MADQIEVKPTPIQRNTFDVATELTQMFFSKFSIGSEEEVQKTFAKFYAVADLMRVSSYKNLGDFLQDQDLKKLLDYLVSR